MRRRVFLRGHRAGHWASAALLAAGLTLSTAAEPLPSSLAGSWHIVRVLPTGNVGCWNADQARELVGSTLVYGRGAMRWQGGEVPLQGITTREVTAAQFHKENSGETGGAEFSQLGIRSARVLEIDLQHEDMDITGASTEVPGDSVLLAGPNRIVVSACGVFMEAVRGSGNLVRASAR